MNAEIIAIGSELLTPYRQDTNSLYLTDHLDRLGIAVRSKCVVGDDRAHIAAAVRLALDRSDVVVCIGGLGPTEDDLTREAAADALGLALKRDADLVAQLYARFASFRRKMSPNNLRQADLLPEAVPLPNANGTAPGQWLETTWQGEPRYLLLLPGPPHELQPMFEEQCLERLRRVAPQVCFAGRVLKVAMVGESDCDSRAAPIYKRHRQVETTVLAGPGEVQLHLRAAAATAEKAQRLVDTLASELEDCLGDHVFSTAGESLEQIVGYYLDMRGATVAVAESCTAGLLASRITAVSGSSRYFLGGAVVYSNKLKTAFAGVPSRLIAQHGSVSREVAAALAEGIRKRCRATLGVAITGIAGPGGGSPEKPVGLVFHALADAGVTKVVQRRFPGNRERIRMWATQQALDMVRRHMM